MFCKSASLCGWPGLELPGKQQADDIIRFCWQRKGVQADWSPAWKPMEEARRGFTLFQRRGAPLEFGTSATSAAARSGGGTWVVCATRSGITTRAEFRLRYDLTKSLRPRLNKPLATPGRILRIMGNPQAGNQGPRKWAAMGQKWQEWQFGYRQRPDGARRRVSRDDVDRGGRHPGPSPRGRRRGSARLSARVGGREDGDGGQGGNRGQNALGITRLGTALMPSALRSTWSAQLGRSCAFQTRFCQCNQGMTAQLR